MDTETKLGWVCTSRVKWILYFVPGRDELYVVRLAVLRTELPRFIETLPHRQVPNDGYHTHGLLLPLRQLDDLATGVVNVSGGTRAATRAAALMTTGATGPIELLATENARLYDELTDAADSRDWVTVRNRAENILTLSADDSIARAMYNLAESRSDESDSEASEWQQKVDDVKEEFPNAWEPWTVEQEHRLAELFQSGLATASISQALMRTRGAVAARLRKLGLSE